jgi:hypothetical protein
MNRLFLSEISLPLAAEDTLLVVFFTAGLYFVAKIVLRECGACGKLAFLGGALITLGGALKVSWKLILALTGNDIAWLSNSLFVFMSVGFICLAWALWRSRKTNSPVVWAFVPIFLIAASLGSAAYFALVLESRAWFFVLLGSTTIFNLLVSIQLILRSYSNRAWLSFALFIFNLLCVFLLAGMSDQTLTLQWIKQTIGTFSQASFAIASWKLYLTDSLRTVSR